MMSLEDTLRGVRDASAKRIPAEKAAIMHRATEELRRSGIMGRVIKVGDPLPPFALPNAYGEEVRSADLLAKGPLVLTFFRGAW
jgi:AhpC/TSA family